MESGGYKRLLGTRQTPNEWGAVSTDVERRHIKPPKPWPDTRVTRLYVRIMSPRVTVAFIECPRTVANVTARPQRRVKTAARRSTYPIRPRNVSVLGRYSVRRKRDWDFGAGRYFHGTTRAGSTLSTCVRWDHRRSRARVVMRIEIRNVNVRARDSSRFETPRGRTRFDDNGDKKKGEND